MRQLRRTSQLLVGVLLAAIDGSASAGEAQTSGVVFVSPAEVKGTLTLRSSSDDTIVREMPLSSTHTVVQEAPGSSWEVVFASDRWWTPPLTATFPAEGTEERTLPFWRLGVVEGQVLPATKEVTLPSSIALVVESPPMPQKPPEIPRGTRFECPVTPAGHWTCKLPAAVLDLVLRSSGMTPHYRWDVSIRADKPSQLGVFRLRPGASVSAWLDRTTIGVLTKPAKGRLVRPVANEASPAEARLRAPVAEAEFSQRGMVQLAPVAEGTYILEVEAPGFATSRIGPLEVYEGRETVFRKTIELQRPFSAHIAVQPPVDPTGAPWLIAWQRQNDFASSAEVLVTRSVDERGGVSIPGQSKGTFIVQVRDTQGNTIWDKIVAIADENQARIDVHLELHKVSGTVKLAGEPLSATLWFGTRDGAERIQLTASEEGSFEGYLPRRGRWPVEVVHGADVRSIVEVEATDDELEIRLADTYIAGWVVGTDGQRVKRGSVMVRAGNRGFTSTTDPSDGHFEFRGVPEGRVQLMARDLRTRESTSTVSMELKEKQRAEGVELRIQPLKAIAGRVLSRGQEVIGAKVSAVAREMGGQLVRSAVTDLNGRFSVPVVQGAQRMLITVAAPGRTLQSFERPVGTEELVLDVAAIGGMVEVSAPGDFRLKRDGVDVPMNELFDWMAAHGDPLTDTVLRIPDLAPGHYQLCAHGAPPSSCASGNLSPGGSLRLAIRHDSAAR